MAFDDDLKEIYDLARRALTCQAELGHKEIIFEAHARNPGQTAPDGAMAFSSRSRMTPHPGDQISLLNGESSEGGDSHFAGLEEHHRAICGCTKCPLGQTRTKFVYGVGNPEARIMFIGEAPGREEDLQGEPFVGRAGKLLDRILAAMGFTREDVYIGNILKCRPPENRDPQPEEMRLCLPYLREQVRLIKPQFICALGRVAAHGMLETTTPLGKLRGHWHRFEGTPVIVTYHPAALLRFPQYKRPTWEDMQMLMAEYERVNENRK